METSQLPKLNAPIERDPTDANDWWEKHAPKATAIWGKPVLYSGIPNVQGLAMAIPEISTKIVWENGWYYHDHALGLFARTSEARIGALFQRMVIKSAEQSGTLSMSAVTIPLIGLRDQVVETAKQLLAVGPEFWDRHPRIVAGRKEEVPPLESVAEFAGACLEEGEKQCLPLNQAYERYVMFCEKRRSTPLKKGRFGEEIGIHIQKRYGVRMRNDIVDGSRKTRGWKAVGLKA